MEKCSQCGAPLENGVCPYCGMERAASKAEDGSQESGQNTVQPVVVNVQQGNVGGVAPVAAPMKNKWTTLILCIFLGYFGAHYFYVGKIGWGVLYLFTLGLFGIGWLVDIVRIIIDGFDDKYGRHLVS